MAAPAQLGLQDPSSPTICQITQFHDHAIVIASIIIVFVGAALFLLIKRKFTARYILDAQTIETLWTLLPAIILLFLAAPSLRLLYIIEEVNNPLITIKTVGHQWYWSYEYSDFSPNIRFDSYIVPTDQLTLGQYRLLEVDNRLVVPINTEIRLLVTSTDVLHSWTVPSLGIKSDAIPGRLNQLGFTCNRPGVFFGQCSEICGANHSFIPISLETLNWEGFQNWIIGFNL